MNILFKNTTKYTKENYWNFLKFHDKEFGLQYRLLTIIVSIILLYLVASNIVAKNITLVFILFAAFIAYLFYRYYSQEKIVKDELKGESIQKQKEYTFIFYEDKFCVKEGVQKQIIQYNKIYKVFETSDYFYMYTDKTHSLMLAKCGFEVGNSEDFGVFMKKKYLFKYKVKK